MSWKRCLNGLFNSSKVYKLIKIGFKIEKMKVLIRRIKTRTYDEIFRQRIKKLMKDIILLVVLILVMYGVELFSKGKTITLFGVIYSLDIVLFYILFFIFIISSSFLLLDLRNFMNIVSRWVITRFPRMKGDFGPGKRIFRNMVHIVILFLIFSPLADLVQDKTINLFIIDVTYLHIISLFFLVLTLFFVYDILIQILRILGEHFKKLNKVIKVDKSKDIEIK